MPKRSRKQYLVIARNNISRWVKIRAISNKGARAIAVFIWKDIIYRHDIFWKIVINKGEKFKAKVLDLLNG
jgi:hypothetical protein